MTCYQATNVAEALMTQRYLESQKVFESQDRTLQVFYTDAISYTCGKGYQIIDLDLFKELI